MIVSELIAELEKQDPNKEIIVSHDLEKYTGDECYIIEKINQDFDDKVILIEINY